MPAQDHAPRYLSWTPRSPAEIYFLQGGGISSSNRCAKPILSWNLARLYRAHYGKLEEERFSSTLTIGLRNSTLSFRRPPKRDARFQEPRAPRRYPATPRDLVRVSLEERGSILKRQR